jgi:hypothetical protein
VSSFVYENPHEHMRTVVVSSICFHITAGWPPEDMDEGVNPSFLSGRRRCVLYVEYMHPYFHCMALHPPGKQWEFSSFFRCRRRQQRNLCCAYIKTVRQYINSNTSYLHKRYMQLVSCNRGFILRIANKNEKCNGENKINEKNPDALKGRVNFFIQFSQVFFTVFSLFSWRL